MESEWSAFQRTVEAYCFIISDGSRALGIFGGHGYMDDFFHFCAIASMAGELLIEQAGLLLILMSLILLLSSDCSFDMKL